MSGADFRQSVVPHFHAATDGSVLRPAASRQGTRTTSVSAAFGRKCTKAPETGRGAHEKRRRAGTAAALGLLRGSQETRSKVWMGECSAPLRHAAIVAIGRRKGAAGRRDHSAAQGSLFRWALWSAMPILPHAAIRGSVPKGCTTVRLSSCKRKGDGHLVGGDISERPSPHASRNGGEPLPPSKRAGRPLPQWGDPGRSAIPIYAAGLPSWPRQKREPAND